MAQIFHRSTNTVAKVTLFGAVFFVAVAGWVAATLDRSAYSTRQGVVREQPVPFSHDHHVVALGIDCRYCHTAVETEAFAGIPPTTTCINCHKLIWNESDMLAPVRASLAEDTPIRWTRVHDLPDFVYFDHSIHVAKGVGCATCHGRVDQMPLVYQAASLQMEWCLECHRHPERYVGPREQVFNMAWKAPDQATLGPALVAEYHVDPRTDCSTCHR
ncbi:MAG: cytochrome c family protein [Acidobacteriota bacterium]|nr:cytochrome c family protein [Acidobacteriota bacterium]